MRCLYCGKQLALLRRLTGGGEFCSEAHKQSYDEEYNKLALSRLMQGQTKSDEVRRPLAKPDGAAQLLKSAPPSPQPNEPSWTTVHPRTDQKRISAAAETRPVPEIASPPKANFIADKPALSAPANFEAQATEALRFLRNGDVQRPVQVKPQTGFIPDAAGTLKPTLNPVARASPMSEKTPAPASALLVAAQVTTALLPIVTCTAGLQLADLVPLEATAIPRIGEEPVRPASDARFNPIELQNYLPLIPRAFPPSELISAVPSGHVLPALELTLPVNSPLPLRPKTTSTDSGSSQDVERNGARRAVTKVKLGPAMPKPESIQAELNVDGETGETPGAASGDIDLPPFLRASDPDDKSARVWGNVQKYLKNLVGCLLFATLIGVAGWNLRAGATPAATPLFIYPESLALQDYRVEFEVPASNKTVEWVFRAPDPRHCYAMRLAPEPGSSTPRFHIAKTIVVDGEHLNGKRLESGVFRLLRASNSKYEIRLEIRGSQFLTYSQGQLIDRWNDPTFRRGGFGYYSRSGEPAPIQSVRFTDLAAK